MTLVLLSMSLPVHSKGYYFHYLYVAIGWWPGNEAKCVQSAGAKAQKCVSLLPHEAFAFYRYKCMQMITQLCELTGC